MRNMKVDRHGQAEPIYLNGYRKIREGFNAAHHKLCWDLAYYTGERWGAIVQLAVTDVYDERGLPRTSVTFKKNTRKDKQTRQVPTADHLALRLKAYARPNSIWLFPSPDAADRHLSIRALDAAFRRAVDRAGLGSLGYSTHSTRRGFITALHRQGFDVRVIQEITGHRNLAVLARYIDVTDHQKRSAIATL
jgi:integrase/recombinase XerD